MFVVTKDVVCVCRDKSKLVVTKLVTTFCLSRQKVCHNKGFVATSIRDCREKTFVATKKLFVASPTSVNSHPVPVCAHTYWILPVPVLCG